MSHAVTQPSKEDVLQACANGSLEQVLSMLPECTDPPSPDDMAEKAAENAQLPIVCHFIPHLRPHWYRPLATAAVKGKSQPVLQALLDAGLDINKDLGYMGTPLLYATVLGHPTSYIEWLLDLGADPNIGHVSTFYTGLHLAARQDTPDVLKLFLKHGAQVKGSKALLGASIKGKLDMLKILVEDAQGDIDEMPDPEEEWSDGAEDVGTPLHAAARCGHVEVVSYLLEKGADPRLKDARGNTAQDLAEANGNNEIVSMLQGRV